MDFLPSLSSKIKRNLSNLNLKVNKNYGLPEFYHPFLPRNCREEKFSVIRFRLRRFDVSGVAWEVLRLRRHRRQTRVGKSICCRKDIRPDFKDV